MNDFENKVKELKKLDELIFNRTEEFKGDVEAFEWFVKCGIERELFALTTNDYKGVKPGKSEYNDNLHNIRILEELFTLIAKKQQLQSKLEI
jgi:hypothetical protein